MATKVKGDAIKEGSIPFEALDASLDSVPALRNFIKKLDENDPGKDIEIPYCDHIVLYYGYNIITMNDGYSRDFQSYGPSSKVTLSVRAESSSLILSVSNMETPSMINAYEFKIYKNINKIKKEFLPDDIEGGDWNAQQGEAGYIENRTHANVIETKTITTGGYTLEDGKLTFGHIFNGGDVIRIDRDLIDSGSNNWNNNIKIHGVDHYRSDINEHFFYCVKDIINPSKDKKYPIYFDTDYDNIVGYIKIYEYESEYYLSIITNADQNDTFRVNYEIFKPLDINYLPNTLVKTTPQTLSDIDKNQALANLGIADLLEALKPVQLSGEPPIGNVTQEQLDEIGLTEKVINNILNGYTNRIYFNNSAYIVMFTNNNNNAKEIIFGCFAFENDKVNAYTQYTYRKFLDEITIEFEEF